MITHNIWNPRDKAFRNIADVMDLYPMGFKEISLSEINDNTIVKNDDLQ